MKYLVMMLVALGLASALIFQAQLKEIERLNSVVLHNDSAYDQALEYKEDTINSYSAVILNHQQMLDSRNMSIELLKTKLGVQETKLRKYMALIGETIKVSDTIVDTLTVEVQQPIEHEFVNGRDTISFKLTPPKTIQVDYRIHVDAMASIYLEKTPVNKNKSKLRNWLLSHDMTRFLVKTREIPRCDIRLSKNAVLSDLKCIFVDDRKNN